jgi:hypothetical protein
MTDGVNKGKSPVRSNPKRVTVVCVVIILWLYYCWAFTIRVDVQERENERCEERGKRGDLGKAEIVKI